MPQNKGETDFVSWVKGEELKVTRLSSDEMMEIRYTSNNFFGTREMSTATGAGAMISPSP